MSKLVVDKFGTKRWFIDGMLHREDGPAVEWANGDKFWYFNGRLHREDGPAVEYSNLAIQWWLNGKILTKECWFEKLPEDLKIKVLFNEDFIK
jgi:hypothetical protein